MPRKRLFSLALLRRSLSSPSSKENKKYKKNNNDYGIRAHWFFCLRIIRINWIGIRAQGFKDNYYNWDNFL